MKEAILRAYFEGTITAEELFDDLQKAIHTPGETVVQYPIEDMATEFEVKREHLIKLCDAVLENHLPPDRLEAIGFCIIASDKFFWPENSDHEVIAETLHEWSCPAINYPLNMVT